MIDVSRTRREAYFLATAVPDFLVDHPQYRPGSTLFDLLDLQLRDVQARVRVRGGDDLDPRLIAVAHDLIMTAFRQHQDAAGSLDQLPPSGDRVRNIRLRTTAHGPGERLARFDRDRAAFNARRAC